MNLALGALAPLAIFLPSVSLVQRVWLEGVSAPPIALLKALLPTLLGMLAFAGLGESVLALYLAAWNLRAGMLVLGRQCSGSAALPSFRRIHAFGRETHWWMGTFVAVWLLVGL